MRQRRWMISRASSRGSSRSFIAWTARYEQTTVDGHSSTHRGTGTGRQRVLPFRHDLASGRCQRRATYSRATHTRDDRSPRPSVTGLYLSYGGTCRWPSSEGDRTAIAREPQNPHGPPKAQVMSHNRPPSIVAFCYVRSLKSRLPCDIGRSLPTAPELHTVCHMTNQYRVRLGVHTWDQSTSTRWQPFWR